MAGNPACSTTTALAASQQFTRLRGSAPRCSSNRRCAFSGCVMNRQYISVGELSTEPFTILVKLWRNASGYILSIQRAGRQANNSCSDFLLCLCPGHSPAQLVSQVVNGADQIGGVEGGMNEGVGKLRVFDAGEVEHDQFRGWTYLFYPARNLVPLIFRHTVSQNNHLEH